MTNIESIIREKILYVIQMAGTLNGLWESERGTEASTYQMLMMKTDCHTEKGWSVIIQHIQRDIYFHGNTTYNDSRNEYVACLGGVASSEEINLHPPIKVWFVHTPDTQNETNRLAKYFAPDAHSLGYINKAPGNPKTVRG